MRGLLAAVIGMGVLIVAGVVVIAVTIAHRMSAPHPPAAAAATTAPLAATLAEPAGTRIAGISAAPGRIAVLMQGGGPDRVLVLDEATGRTLLRASLAQ